MTKEQLVVTLKPLANCCCEGYQVTFGKQFYIICEAFGHDPQGILTELGFERDIKNIEQEFESV